MALDVDSGVTSARAQAVTEALCRRIVPLLVLRSGRLEPLASGCLYLSVGHLVLVTCRHVFDDGVALGDLVLPLGDSGRWLALRALEARFMAHPERDIAAIDLRSRSACAALRRFWRIVPFDPHADVDACATQRLVVAGYPYAQMRRIDGAVFARPLVFFARPVVLRGASLHATYARTARRVDGVVVHAPELDGVSGATVWSVNDERDDVECVLLPAGVQCAFKHDQYARGEPIAGAREMLERLMRR
jgi:hypothetical protein